MHKILINLIQRTRKLLIRLWRQEGTPAKRARGVAIGVFSGCFPLFGFQTLIGVFLAGLFKGNLLLAATGTWVSNPFTYIPLYWFNFKVGELFLGKGRNIDAINELSIHQLFDQGWFFSSRLLLGSSVVGLLLGLIAGMMFYILFRRISVMKNN